jgi:hypothetical protein
VLNVKPGDFINVPMYDGIPLFHSRGTKAEGIAIFKVIANTPYYLEASDENFKIWAFGYQWSNHIGFPTELNRHENINKATESIAISDTLTDLRNALTTLQTYTKQLTIQLAEKQATYDSVLETVDSLRTKINSLKNAEYSSKISIANIEEAIKNLEKQRSL